MKKIITKTLASIFLLMLLVCKGYSQTSSNLFIIKLNSSGDIIWEKKLQTQSSQSSGLNINIIDDSVVSVSTFLGDGKIFLEEKIIKNDTKKQIKELNFKSDGTYINSGSIVKQTILGKLESINNSKSKIVSYISNNKEGNKDQKISSTMLKYTFR